MKSSTLRARKTMGRNTSVNRRVLLQAALAFASAAAITPARAQTVPPVRLVVPFTPGTGMDIVARQVQPHLAKLLGRPVVVDNRPGASGNIGAESVVRAAPDGQTLLVTANTLVMSKALYPNLSFDPVQDLQPVSLTSHGTLMLVASQASGIHSAQAFIARAKARPGALNYASPGNGTPHHLAMELLKVQTRSFITHIPYRGTGPAVTDLLGGQVDVMFLPIHVALPQVKAGRLRALAVSSEQPHPLLPDVPPLRGLGLGQIEVEMWYGILAPKGTPAAVVDSLNAALVRILAEAEVKAAFETQGMVPVTSTPAALAQLMERDALRWAKLIREQKIAAD